jgi:hypothetical protein
MASKSDTFVPSTERPAFEATQTNLARMVCRFADDNDSGIPHSFGSFYRTCKTREDAVAFVARSKRGRYLGRKRHEWYLVVE